LTRATRTEDGQIRVFGGRQEPAFFAAYQRADGGVSLGRANGSCAVAARYGRDGVDLLSPLPAISRMLEKALGLTSFPVLTLATGRCLGRADLPT